MVLASSEANLHLKVLNSEGDGVKNSEGLLALQILMNRPIQKMLLEVFPDLGSWFDFAAIGKISERGVAVLMEDDQAHPLGFVHARQEGIINGPEGKEKWLFSILAAAEKGKGVGGILVETLKKEIVSHGGKFLFARTDPSRTDTIAFYMKHGFEIDGVVGHYYYGPTPAVWMWCDLEKNV
jgi:ribosomal protein S18 acetylase RimI-like enzyme